MSAPSPRPRLTLAGGRSGVCGTERRAETDVSGGERDVRPCKGPVWAADTGRRGPLPPAWAARVPSHPDLQLRRMGGPANGGNVFCFFPGVTQKFKRSTSFWFLSLTVSVSGLSHISGSQRALVSSCCASLSCGGRQGFGSGGVRAASAGVTLSPRGKSNKIDTESANFSGQGSDLNRDPGPVSGVALRTGVPQLSLNRIPATPPWKASDFSYGRSAVGGHVTRTS